MRVCSGAVLLVASGLFVSPLLLHSGLPMGTDVGAHAMLSNGMIEGLRDGVLYPRWVEGANRGLGAPAFVFFPPLAYYGVAAAWTATGDLVASMRAVSIAATLLASLAFFFSIRPLTSEFAAAAGAALYVSLPYHAIDLYDRFAFAEFAGFAWIPLLFRFTRDLAEGGSRRAAPGLALCYAGLVLTHMPTAFIGALVLPPYALLLLWRTRRWARLIPMAAAGAAALLLSSIYLVPLQLHRDTIHERQVTNSRIGDWRRNFVYRDEIAHGYRRSSVKVPVERAVTSQVGLALAALIALVAFPPRRREVRREGWVCAAISAWVVFLQTPLSTPVWATVPEMEGIVFPWRYGSYQGFFAAALVSCALAPGRSGSRYRLPALAAALALSAAPALQLSRALTARREYAFGPKQAERAARAGVWRALIPKSVVHWKKLKRMELPEARAGLEAPGRLAVLEWTSHTRRFRIRTPRPNLLWVRTFDHPGWRAKIDGEPARIDPGAGLGNITLEVPAGDHEVALRFALGGG